MRTAETTESIAWGLVRKNGNAKDRVVTVSYIWNTLPQVSLG